MIKHRQVNWDVLSITRFILAFIVVADHLTQFISNKFLKFISEFGAFEAILGFLLISGLSIGKSISRNQDSYFKRRIKRIYPVYFVSMIFSILILPGSLTFGYLIYALLNLLFLNQALTATSLIGPAWTLALEVWLYALAPVFYKLSINKLLILIYISFLSFCFYTCGRTLYGWVYFAGTSYGINLILLSFIWIAGFTLAIYPERKKAISMHIAIIFVAHITLTILIQVAYRYKHHEIDKVYSEDIFHFISRSFCLIGVFFIVIFNNRIPSFPVIIHRIFTLLGNVSYPLYLLHRGVFYQLNKWSVESVWIMISTSLVLAYIVYAVFDSYSKKREEKPIAALVNIN